MTEGGGGGIDGRGEQEKDGGEGRDSNPDGGFGVRGGGLWGQKGGGLMVVPVRCWYWSQLKGPPHLRMLRQTLPSRSMLGW